MWHPVTKKYSHTKQGYCTHTILLCKNNNNSNCNLTLNKYSQFIHRKHSQSTKNRSGGPFQQTKKHPTTITNPF